MKTRILSLLLILSSLCVHAQTTNTLGTTLLYTLSMRNPEIQQTNTFTISIGDGLRTEQHATFQATTLRGLYLVTPKMQLGLRAEFDTLGTGGQDIAGISIGAEARYLSDNLFAAGILGYHRDVEANTRNVEFGIGLGAFLTPNFSVNTELLMQYNGRGRDALSRAVVITASYSF